MRPPKHTLTVATTVLALLLLMAAAHALGPTVAPRVADPHVIRTLVQPADSPRPRQETHTVPVEPANEESSSPEERRETVRPEVRVERPEHEKKEDGKKEGSGGDEADDERGHEESETREPESR